jgi:transposase InsO family protein
MGILSTLRQGQFLPKHGSFWDSVLSGRIRARNPFNPIVNEVECVADKQHDIPTVEVDKPDPRWSVGQINQWILQRTRNIEDTVILSIKQCLPCFIPAISTGKDGLYPIFHNDIFGIKGVSNLSQWIIDSGATSSCTNDITAFSTFSRDVPFSRIRVANGKYAKVAGIGKSILNVADSANGKLLKLPLENVLYIPEVPVNLISTRSLWNHSKISSTFTDKCILAHGDKWQVTFDTGKAGHYYCTATTARDSSSDPSCYVAQHTCSDCDGEENNFSTLAWLFAVSAISTEIVHARLGHCGPDRAVRALQGSVGLPAAPNYRKQLAEHCDGCRQGGAKKQKFNALPADVKPKQFGDRIQSDLCGPFPPSVVGKYIYILSFVDAATGHSEIYFLQTKLASEVKPYFQRFIEKYKQKLPDGKVVEWFTDNGGEFQSNDIDTFCDEFVGKRGFTVPYCSPQNSQAERLWGILQRCIRISLAHSGMPTSFWHYAAKHANDLHNLLPRKTNANGVSPHEAVFGEKPDFSFVRVWGCLTYCTIRNEKDREDRASPTAAKGIHLGRDPVRRGWLVYIPSLNRITTSRDVVFDEDHFLRFDKSGNIMDDTAKFVEDEGPKVSAVRYWNDTVQPAHWRNPPQLGQPSLPLSSIAQQSPIQQQSSQQSTGDDRPGWAHSDASRTHYSSLQCSNPRCSIPAVNGKHSGPCSFEQLSDRTRSGAIRFVEPGSIFFAVPNTIESDDTPDHSNEKWSINTERFGEIPIPNTYEEAMASRFSHRWKEAMEREIRELLGRKTWEAVDIPHGRRATQSRWVYAIKYNSDGTIERFKARFVVKGFSQIYGVDYEQSFSSTMRATTFRTLVALAAQDGLRAEHIDISNAFCQADIDGVDLWVQPPRGFENLCGRGQGLKLLKALYGTKQASYLWQQTLGKWLVDQGFKQLTTDPCVYTKVTNGHRIIVGCYVDDLIVLHDASTNMFAAFRKSFLQKYGGRFDGKHIGQLEWFLGVKVDQRANGDIHIDQSKYITDLLNKFIPNSDTIAFARKVPYPTDKLKALQEAASDAEIERVKKLPYLQLVGALLYLSVMSRPDIAYYMSVLCSFMQNPSVQCFEAAQSVLLYVGHTRKLSIRYSRTYAVPNCLSKYGDAIRSNHGFHAFSDASWTVPKSVCGYSVFLSGGPVAWSSRKLHIIADSSAMAEYSSCSATSKEMTFVRNILMELGVKLSGPIYMGVDNTAAIKISEQRGVTKLTKHFDLAMHRIRDEVERQRLRCVFVDTYDQTADVLTKALGDYEFMRHRDKYFG